MQHKSFPPLLDESLAFPDISDAVTFRKGLVAVGGDLSEERLLSAYRKGIFPWFGENDPICWWTLSPRMVLFPEQLHVGRSVKKAIRAQHYTITTDYAFKEVIASCAYQKRPEQKGTWILPMMQDAYYQLHQLGYAHSFEYWQDGKLLGGLYGVLVGKIFCGESMYAKYDNASKIAFVHTVKFLQKLGVAMIDCQMHTDHLARFGATEIDFSHFQKNLKIYAQPSLKISISPCVIATN